jgi:porphobilinogen synthase
MSPFIRPRRSRQHSWIRDLIAENSLSQNDLVYPIFISEGQNIIAPIPNMESVYVYSIDKMLDQIKRAHDAEIKAITLFPKISGDAKTSTGDEALNPKGLVCRAVQEIKKVFGNDIGVICDVALDPYTTHGHDGVLNSAQTDVDNDKTLEILARQALVLAQSGVDFVSPSDMMDGRIRYIRNELDKHDFTNIGIISYAAKYASKLFGPFRGAIGKTNTINMTKSTYQMDIRNHKEAITEIKLDIEEGADIILVKPAMYCLDVIFNANRTFNIPVFAYQVSGEYTMIKNYSKELNIDFNEIMLESLLCIKRAGAKSILSYAAVEIAEILK